MLIAVPPHHSMTALFPDSELLQEHADVSDSLGRRLREEAEVNAALSQVRVPATHQLCILMLSPFSCKCSPLILFLSPYFFSGEACCRDATSGPKSRKQGTTLHAHSINVT
jgi:hypothetical protein